MGSRIGEKTCFLFLFLEEEDVRIASRRRGLAPPGPASVGPSSQATSLFFLFFLFLSRPSILLLLYPYLLFPTLSLLRYLLLARATLVHHPGTLRLLARRSQRDKLASNRCQRGADRIQGSQFHPRGRELPATSFRVNRNSLFSLLALATIVVSAVNRERIRSTTRVDESERSIEGLRLRSPWRQPTRGDQLPVTANRYSIGGGEGQFRKFCYY